MKKLVILFLLVLVVSIGTAFACDDCISTGHTDNNFIDITANSFIELALGGQEQSSGNTDSRCITCSGRGTVTCSSCSGSGMVGIYYCGPCDYTGRRTCSACNGTGRR